MSPAILPLMVVGACSSRPPLHWYVVCDLSVDPAVCTKDFRVRAAAAWSQVAALAPGSTLEFVFVAGSYSDTSVFALDRSPSQFKRPASASRARWERATIASANEIDVPTVDRNKPQSDVISALLVARELASSAGGASGETKLILASDGLFIGQGFNTERDGFPAVERLLGRLRSDAGIEQWSLEDFDSIHICGFANTGLDLSTASARVAFYDELFAAAGVEPPMVSSSCADAYPPVPGDLEPAKPSADALGGRG